MMTVTTSARARANADETNGIEEGGEGDGGGTEPARRRGVKPP